MNKEMTLCKLAVAVPKTDLSDTSVQKDDDNVFEYKNTTWKALDFFKTNKTTFKDITVQINDNNAMKKKFKLQELFQNGRTWLVLSFVSNSNDHQDWIGRLHMHINLFLILFRNFVDVNILSGNIYEPSKIMKKYVTTKLYDALQKKHSTIRINNEKLNLPACFRSKLCRYQEKAVHWLCDQETNPKSVPNLYDKLFARDNETCVYSHKLCLNLLEDVPENIHLPPGGILADEMGLGKTVEILALILLQPRPSIEDLPSMLKTLDCTVASRKENIVFCLCGSTKTSKAKGEIIQCQKCCKLQHLKCVGKFNGDHNDKINLPYVCPQCWSDISEEELVPSRATFIVSPNAIKLQWLSEIRKHVYPSLRVFVYDGISKRAWISPRQLAQYDVVLTDYSVLRSEVYHTSDNVSNRVKRHESRFMRCNTPLLMIQWWRVCLDEAQMVESNASQMAKLAFKLPAINRWAVTGTPIQNSIDDLQALLGFIGFNAICYPKSIWENLVRDFLIASETRETEVNANLLIDLLQLCMWRTCKSKVESELNIPPQTQEVHFITLSNLEKLFYSEQHEECKETFNDTFNSYMERTQRYRSVTAEISPDIMKNFLKPLLKIRQCCTIPVVVSSMGKQGYNVAPAQKKFLQPKDLHEHLKNANEMECKSELRSIASSYNGLAAIYFIRKNYEEAIRHYEFVLKLARDYDEHNITVDSLLQIHALHNILQAYYTSPKHSKELPSDTIQRYEEQCNKLEWKYLEPYATQMKRVQEAFENEVKAYTMMTSETATNLLQFIAELTEIITDDNEQLHNPLMAKISEECICIFPDTSIMQAMSSIHSTLYVLHSWCDKVFEVRTKLIDGFKRLEFFTNNVHSRSQVNPSIWREMMKFVNKVYDCHLSEIREKHKDKEQEAPSNKKLKKSLCDLCKVRDALNSFECLLFNKVIDKETNITEGLANPSPQITLIKVIFQFAKSKTKFVTLAPEFDKHWELINCMQSMWKKMLNFWIEIDYTVKAYDELDMCKMRISLTDNEDEKSNFKLLDYEIDDIFAEQQSNLYTAQREFAVKFARMKYILHLEANSDPGPCPICHSDDEPRYAVLECGHHICICCLEALKKFNKKQSLNCSICRHQQSSYRIYYVNRTMEQTEGELDVKGDYSSKITCIVRQILKLKNEVNSPSETPKVIIFSQWEPILLAIGAALTENGIRHRIKWSPQSIEEFKNPHLGITCMLMALAKGSKGLNLIEATHVFLVEPILNPAEELQAIGRVHRLGQTKPTVVHRFIVLNTIEENIYHTVNRGKDGGTKWEFENMTLESLRNLLHLGNDIAYDF